MPWLTRSALELHLSQSDSELREAWVVMGAVGLTTRAREALQSTRSTLGVTRVAFGLTMRNWCVISPKKEPSKGTDLSQLNRVH